MRGESFNFGPVANTNQSVIELVSSLAGHWPGARWEVEPQDPGAHRESTLLKLCCDKALNLLGWHSVLSLPETDSAHRGMVPDVIMSMEMPRCVSLPVNRFKNTLAGPRPKDWPGPAEMHELSEISGVLIQPLKQIVDQRGAVLHMLRCDSPLCSADSGKSISPSSSPGWSRPGSATGVMTQHFAVPLGKIRLVFYDDRPEGSPSQGRLEEHILGRPDHYAWSGFHRYSGMGFRDGDQPVPGGELHRFGP